MTAATLSLSAEASAPVAAPRQGAEPSFRSALVGFLASTFGVTALMVLLSAL